MQGRMTWMNDRVGMKKIALRVSLIGAVILAALCFRMFRSPEPIELVFTGATMATSWSAKVIAPSDSAGVANRCRQAVEKELEQVNRDMSLFHEGGAVFRLNAAPAGQPVPVPRSVMDLLVQARRISEQTDGAFDVTVGPLVRLWGFHSGEAPAVLPEDADIAAVRRKVGYRKLVLSREDGTVTKTVDGLEVDLSAIAKGRAVDLVASALNGLGMTNYMVEVGGEVRARGRNRHREPWRIGIEEPVDEDVRRLNRIIGLHNRSLATSGDYRNFYICNGRRYSHTIDPSTGRPVSHELASVSVLARDCMTADALATALSVLGVEKGMPLAERKGWAAYFITRNAEGKTLARATRRFDDLAR